MKLKKLELFGFKSFGQRAIIFALSAGAVVTWLSFFGVASGHRAVVLLVYLMTVPAGMLASNFCRPDLMRRIEDHAINSILVMVSAFAAHIILYLMWQYVVTPEMELFTTWLEGFVGLCKQFVGVFLAVILVVLLSVVGFVIHRWGEVNTPDGLYRRTWVKPVMVLSGLVFVLLAYSIVFERDGGAGASESVLEPSVVIEPVSPVSTSGKGSGGQKRFKRSDL